MLNNHFKEGLSIVHALAYGELIIGVVN